MIKPETVTIVVYPSGADSDALTVSDAMQQVLDIFALLAKAEAGRIGSEQVVWRLQSASTNSPFTVSAVAVASDPVTVVDRQAQAAKMALGEGWNGLLSAREKAPWIDTPTEQIVQRVLARSLNGVGRTDIRFDDDETPDIIIDHQAAVRADNYLRLVAAEAAAAEEDLTRTEYGGIEGYITDITTHYRKPAFVVRERISNRDITCVVMTQDAEVALGGHQWREAWTDQRVFVSGKIYYNAKGQILKVDAETLDPVQPKDVDLADLQQGVPGSDQPSPREFLDQSWGDDHNG